MVELFQVFQLEQLCTFSIFYLLMIWPGRPNHDIEGWDLFSKNSGSREELKMVQDRILLRYFEWNLSPPHLLSLLHKGISEVKGFPYNKWLRVSKLPSFNIFVVESITCSGSGIFALLFCISAACSFLHVRPYRKSGSTPAIRK